MDSEDRPLLWWNLQRLARNPHGPHPSFGTWYHCISLVRLTAPSSALQRLAPASKFIATLHQVDIWRRTRIHILLSLRCLGPSSSFDPHIGKASNCLLPPQCRPSANHSTCSFLLQSSLTLMLLQKKPWEQLRRLKTQFLTVAECLKVKSFPKSQGPSIG